MVENTSNWYIHVNKLKIFVYLPKKNRQKSFQKILDKITCTLHTLSLIFYIKI